MDGELFDQITRALAAGTSRRRVLQGLTGGVLGTLAGALGLRQAEAGPPPKHCKFQDYACRFNTNCCSLNCCNRVCCGEGQACVGGQCVAAVCTPDNATACAGRECGTPTNNCGQTVTCGTCTGTGETCNTMTGMCEPSTQTCPAGADPCVLPVACNPANPDCACFTSVGGTTVCGTFVLDYCPIFDQCNTDADCPGGYCVSTPCACLPVGGGFRECIVPC